MDSATADLDTNQTRSLFRGPDTEGFQEVN